MSQNGIRKKLIQGGFVCGNQPVEAPLNLKDEIRRFRIDPLSPLIDFLGDDKLVVHGDTGRYYRAYDYYALALERVLCAISVGRRFQSQVQPYYGGGREFSPQQCSISRQYRDQRRFFELDFTNYLIHSRILLDRTIGITHRFLTGAKLPSFSSFNNHKKFFRKHSEVFGSTHSEYCNKIIMNTDWFDMPIKAVRDKLLVHTPPEHFLFLGYPNNHDMEMIFILNRKHKQFGTERWVSFSVRRIARDIEGFLTWYNSYALNAIRKTIGKERRSS